MKIMPSALLLACAVYNLGFLLFHLCFWRLFDWRTDLTKLTRVNRGAMQVMNLCLIFIFGFFAYLLLVHRHELLSSVLGRTVLGGMALFWFLRMIEQVVFFGFRRRMSIGFSVLFAVGALLHSLPLLAR